jgi:hypothetical protein
MPPTRAETAVGPLDVQWSRMVREWTRLAKDSEQRRELSLPSTVRRSRRRDLSNSRNFHFP